MYPSQKICADCQHLRLHPKYTRHGALCGSPAFAINPVTGEPAQNCEMQRARPDGKCGVDGKLFEQRDAASWVAWVSRPGVMSKRSQEMLRWAAEDLADPVFQANPERMARERQLAVLRLAPHIEDVVQLAWRQLQADLSHDCRSANFQGGAA
jgi:hypothetical protein